MPFADSNGRMGRLWQTVILSRWHPSFATLPVESLVHQRTIERAVAKLRKAGRLQRVGAIKGGHWEVL